LHKKQQNHHTTKPPENSSKNYTVKIFILFLLFNEKRLAFCTQAIVDGCHWRQE
jgi:hypothetical protein